MLANNRVTKSNPCPICNKTDWCFFTDDLQAVVCGRISPGSEPVGWRYSGKQAKDGRPIYCNSESFHKGNGKSVDAISQNRKPSQKNLKILKTESSQPGSQSSTTNPTDLSSSSSDQKSESQLSHPQLAKVTTPLLPQTFKSGTNETTTYYPYTDKLRVIRRDYSNKPKFVRPQFLPQGSDNFDFGLGSEPWPLFNLDQMEKFGSCETWALWLEGEKCCVIASTHGLLAITSQGAKWGKDYLASELVKLVGKIGGVCVVPDNDKPGEKKAKTVHEVCQSVGLPSVLLSRESLYEGLSEGADIEQIAQKLDGRCVPDFFQDLLTLNFSDPVPPPPPKPSKEITQEFIDSLPPEAKEPDKKITARDLADQLVKDYKDKFCFSHKYDSWYQWMGTHWEPIKDKVFEIHLREDCDKYYRITSVTWLDQIARFLATFLVAHKKTDLTKGGYLNFKNGCLNLNAMELISTTPSDWVVSVLPRDYSVMNIESNILASLARLCPYHWQFFNQSMSSDPQKVLLLLACMNGVLKQKFSECQRFLWLYGLPATGKGTFTRLLTDLVGKENTYSTDLGKLSEDREKAALADKTITFLPDQDKQVSGFGILKSLVGQDAISGRLLYKEPFTFVYAGTVVLTSNTPVLKGDTTGLDRRTLLIHFKNPVDVENRDKRLSQKLASELDRLTPLALSLPDKLVEDFILSTGEGQILEFEAAKWETQCDSDSISAWIDERVIFDCTCSEPVGNAESTLQHLYPNYLEFCKLNNFNPKGSKTFSLDVILVALSQGYKVEKIPTRKGKIIKGLRLKTELDKDLEFQTTRHYPSHPSHSLSDKLSDSSHSSVTVITDSSHSSQFTDLTQDSDSLESIQSVTDGDGCDGSNQDCDGLKPIHSKAVTGGDGCDGLKQKNILPPKKESLNDSLTLENSSKVEPHTLSVVLANYSEVEDSLGSDDLPILQDEPVTLVTLLVAHYNDPQQLHKICAQYSDRDFDKDWGKLFSLINEKADYQVAIQALRDIMNARFKYKVLHFPKTFASGTLLNHLIEIFKASKKQFPTLLPDGVVYSNLTFDEWDDYFTTVQKAQSQKEI